MLEPSEGGRARASAPVRALADRLELPVDQASALVSATLFQFSFVAGVAILKAATNALLVHRVAEPRTLPALYVAASLVTGAVAVFDAMARPQKRWPPTMTFASWVVGFLALTTLAHGGVPFAVEGLYLAGEVYATTLSVRFWARMSELFDVRASRRVLGLIGGVGMAGSVFGGLLTSGFGASLGAVRLVPGACLSLVACLLLAPGLRSDGVRAPVVSAHHATTTSVSPRRYVLTDGLPRTMALLAALLGVATAMADYLFRYRAKESLSDGELAAVFGGLSVVVGLVAMFVQLALTGALLKRIGLFAYLLVTPLGCLLFAASAVATPALWPAYALKVVEQVGSLSLTQTGFQLLYGPMPDAVRGAARSAVDALGKKGGFALGGVLLVLLAGGDAEGTRLPLFMVGVALVAMFVLLRVRAHYVRTIGARLQAPVAVTPEAEVAVTESTTRRVLELAVRSTDERRVLTALELLARDRGARLEPVLLELLGHGSAQVRVAAARLAGERGAQSCAVPLTRLASEDEPIVREAAIDAVATLRPFTAVRLLGPLLSHPDLGTRAAAIAALVPLDPAGPAGKALDELIERGAQALPGERAQVARLLGRLGQGAYARRLRAYLQDPTPFVRKAACEAAGRSGSLELVDDLLQLLVARDTRADARGALALLGDRILPKVQALLNDRTAHADLRYRLPRLLRDIGTAKALEVILFSNPFDDPFLQYRLSTAASRIREQHPDIEFDRRRALEAAGRRLEAYEQLVPVTRDLGAALGPNLLVRALVDRLDQHLESVVRLCALLYPARQVINAYNRFIDGDARTRPYAVELLEHTIEDGWLARRVVTALEQWHRNEAWFADGRVNRAPARLLELVASADTVVRAIALVTVRQLAAARQGPLQTGIDTGLHTLAGMARGAAWDVLLNAPPPIPEEGPVSEAIVEKLLFLEGVDLFCESDIDDLAAVAPLLREQTFRKGEAIYRENDPGDSMYIIVEGHVRVDKDGRRLLDLGPRESFGETTLLDNNPRPATARAVTDVKVLVLHRADFLDLVSDRVEVLRGIFRVMTKQLRGVLDAAAAGRITTPGLTPVSTARRLKTNPGI